MKKLKEGQVVMYRGEKHEFVEYDPRSQTGINQRVILKKEGVEPVHIVLERELEV
jgi:ABC-type Zn uptake system ZnuABC Zn-binding protein ZnuA|tara:strand:- start:96 stop:260 length:165 start_codon:yes stop_codon:yes gene_type:complete